MVSCEPNGLESRLIVQWVMLLLLLSSLAACAGTPRPAGLIYEYLMLIHHDCFYRSDVQIKINADTAHNYKYYQRSLQRQFWYNASFAAWRCCDVARQGCDVAPSLGRPWRERCCDVARCPSDVARPPRAGENVAGVGGQHRTTS